MTANATMRVPTQLTDAIAALESILIDQPESPEDFNVQWFDYEGSRTYYNTACYLLIKPDGTYDLSPMSSTRMTRHRLLLMTSMVNYAFQIEETVHLHKHMDTLDAAKIVFCHATHADYSIAASTQPAANPGVKTYTGSRIGPTIKEG